MTINLNNILYTAVVTPMLDGGKIDFVSFERLLRQQEDADCGVLILGSTGEALALTFTEQCQVVEFTCALNLNVPLLVGVGGYQLPQQVQWLDFCNQQKIDGYLIVTPIYAKPGTQGQIAWFNTLLDRSQKPCMLYNVPSRTGVNLCFQAFDALKEHPNLWALKEASGDIERFKRYVEIASSVAVYSGEDAMMPELAQVGAKGLVSVVSNLWPIETKCYVTAALAGKITNEEQSLWQTAAKACFSVANPIPAKVWLAHTNKIASNTLRAPLVASELTGLAQLSEADEILKAYYTAVV
ncbi:4-hydroxy-tetrahydrodipicolinate synthase [Fastidiosibacter lacustris]|uniref:4-hydroxy-tetrahydrodipicolinate synthase n=1 Tax=Fastidiosibacter lacustris TaxID=2056695 RepID=UPI000E34B9A5|nr:4-hydroxy-tetrahydrodipicolinate synthase [Fastidiosibacter lacustris]